MPFINGRYHINPIMGQALEAAREAEAALAALQQRASRDSSDSSNDASRDDSCDPDDPTTSDAIAGPGPIHHVEIEASETCRQLRPRRPRLCRPRPSFTRRSGQRERRRRPHRCLSGERSDEKSLPWLIRASSRNARLRRPSRPRKFPPRRTRQEIGGCAFGVSRFSPRPSASLRCSLALIPRPQAPLMVLNVHRGIGSLSSWNSMGGYSNTGTAIATGGRRRPPRRSCAIRFWRSPQLIVTLGWRGIRWTMHPRAAATTGYAPSPAGPQSRSSLWQLDFTQTLEGAANDAAAGSLGAAEMGVDRAHSMITTARVLNSGAPTDFFAPALAEFDHIVQQHPDDRRLYEHVTLARISLAELVPRRTRIRPPPRAAQSPAPCPSARRAESPRFRCSIPRPRRRIIDATLMRTLGDSPAARLARLADNIRVENLTFAGAAQTLDGIRWRNVIFIGTRLRYEGGPLDLQNVQFIRCRFGFVNDDRGARLASAIANGKTSLTIE